MPPKSHDRAPDKKGFSVALPKKLLADIEAIAAEQHRSRNGQIEHFLQDAVDRYNKPALKVADEPGKESSPSSHATGANSVTYPSARRGKKTG